jgi:hypothetical protein
MSSKKLFQLGQVVITSNANNVLNQEDVADAIGRHVVGDWGDLDQEDKDTNNSAITYGDRVLSSYRDRNKTKFWIITEADRSYTTVLLPEDY